MSNRDAFRELLYSTNLNSLCSNDEFEEKISEIRTCIKTNIPSKLYKYRTPEKRNFDAFRNDQLWGGSILSFNDSLECLPYYDRDKVNDEIDQEFSPEIIIPIVEQINSGSMPESFTKLLSKEYLDNLKEKLSLITSPKDIENNLAISKNQIIPQLKKIVDELEIAFFEGILENAIKYKIACLSETNSSSLMWGHYANNHRGFCLEYDISLVLEDCHKNCTDIKYCAEFMMKPAIAPVVYNAERFDATSAFVSMIMNYIKDICKIDSEYYYSDLLLAVKVLLTKSKDWAYEKEWRIFNKEECSVQHNPLLNIRPKAAYMGIRMSPEHKTAIKEICKDKGILCYQMVPQYFNSSYEIKPIEVDL